MIENIKYHKEMFDIVTRFKINKNDLYADKQGIIWEGENEFKMDNKLFDVLEIAEDKNDPDYLIVYAINDLQEEMVIKSFSHLIDDVVNGKTGDVKIRTVLSNLISQALPKIDFSFIPVMQSYIVFQYSELLPKSFNTSPLAPPPKTS